jgi:hypothetical protein
VRLLVVVPISLGEDANLIPIPVFIRLLSLHLSLCLTRAISSGALATGYQKRCRRRDNRPRRSNLSPAGF